jgi:2'-5' RNA ligase
MDTVRAFVGCLLDLGSTRRVIDLQRALRKNADAAGWRASWVPPPNLHITLKFLGEIDLGLVEPLSDALAIAARRHSPIRVGIAGLGAFPEKGTPSVLFADITKGSDRLTTLARGIDDAFFDLGLPRDTRAFRSHVTLARVKDVPPNTGSVAAIAPKGALADCGNGYITEIALYRSDLLREGVEYHALGRHSLTGQD